MTTPLVQTLSSFPLFERLSPAEVEEVAQACVPITLKAQSPLFREGDKGDGLYLVISGTMDVIKKDHARQHQKLAIMSAPAVLGEMSLLADDAPRSATLMAEQECQLVKLGSHQFRALVEEGRPAATKLLHNLARVLSRRLSQVDEKLVEVLGHQKREELKEFHDILSRWKF